MRNHMHTYRHTLLLLLSLWFPLAACSSSQSVSLPALGTVIEIVVTAKTNGQNKRTIQNRAVIERVLKLLNENNRGWDTSWHTFPTPAGSVHFMGENNTVLFSLWFGPNWLGAATTNQQGKRNNYLWSPSPDVMREVRQLLAINA